MVAQRKTMSVAEFMALPDDGNVHEFVRGEVRVMPPPKGNHGLIELETGAALVRYLDDRARALGWDTELGPEARRRLVGFAAGGEFGMRFALPDDPNQVRGADVALVPAEQYAQVEWDEDQAYFPAVPWLVVEVISPAESAMDVDEKVQDYLTGGAHRVWCVYPLLRRIHVRDSAAPTRVLRPGDTLTDEELLPGFSLPLNFLFSARSDRP